MGKALRILMLEDVPGDAALIEGALAEDGFKFVAKRVETRDTFEHALDEFSPDIILADYKLPAFDGKSALSIVKQRSLQVPVIMVTGALGDELAVELLKLGARDYILKDRLARLAPAIRRALAEEQETRTRKAAERTLRISELRFRSFFAATCDGIFIVDAETALIEEVNPRLIELLGCSHADLLGKMPWETPDLGKAIPNRAALEAITGKDKRHVENLTLRTRAGRDIHVELSATTYLCDTKRVVQCSLRDVTTGVQAHEALERSERHYRKVIESSSDIILLMDPSGLIVSRSESGKRLSGWEPGDVVGKNIVEFLPEEVYAQTREAIAEVLSAPGKAVTLESKLRRQDGTLVDVEVQGRNLLHDPDVGWIVVTARDISGRKAAEREIRAVNRALKTLSSCNFALIHADSELTLLQEMCRIVVDEGGYPFAWVGFRKAQSGAVLTPVARHGRDVDFVALEAGADATPAAAAVATDQVQIFQDLRHYPPSSWSAEALRRGFQATIAAPIHGAAGATGVLAIYAEEPWAFGEKEESLIRELTDDLSFGLAMLHTQNVHEQSAARLQESMQSTVRAVASTIEMRDPYTAGHQQRVAELSVAIARKLGLAESRVHGLHLAGIVHDVGKIRVPSEILTKPARLNALEYELVRAHPQTGYDILKDVDFPWPIALTVLQHHEHIDGSGYPAGLTGGDILLEAKILTVADVVEAVSSFRPYRPARGLDAGLKEVLDHRGTFYDAAVVDACVYVIRNGFQFRAGTEFLWST